MPLSPTAALSLVDQAIEGMRELLASGEWRVGMRIPPEPSLAEALGVSRNTVREAVRALAHTGVLEVRRGDGTYVASPNEVTALVRQQLARTDLRHVLEVRHAIESQAAALAAERRSAEDIGFLERALGRRDRAVAAQDEAGCIDADAEFHLGVVAAAHNPLLVELYGGFTDNLRSSILLPASHDDALRGEHVALLEAIRSREPEAAAAATGRLLAGVGH